MSGYTLKTIDDMEARHHGSVKLAGAELGIESFGMQVLDLPPGFADYPEHDHAEDGQEEVYVVLRGSGEFEIDGEPVAIDAGQMVRIDPPRRRKLRAGSAGVTILAIGAPARGAYERPEHFQLAVRS
jgi:mannose-6-phosphate isomerase-like protein (cupin superfamily)